MNLTNLFTGKKALPMIAALGVLAIVIAKNSAEPPAIKPVKEIAVAVSLMPLQRQLISPSVSGYGVVKAAVELQQTAEVSARVTFINKSLIAGSAIKRGELLIQLDDKDYRLALTQSQAQQENISAQQNELATNESSLLQRLQLVNNKIGLAQQELKRKQDLAKQQSLSASQLQAEQQKLIGLQQEAASIDQQVQALPAKKQSLAAQLESAKAAVNQQQRNIERTKIVMPFDGRIRSVDIEKDEFVNQGQSLFQAIGIDQVEIEAQFSLDKLRPFIELAFGKVMAQSGNNIDNSDGRNIGDMIKRAGLTARISVPMAAGEFWHGEVVTIRETLDPASYTLGAVIRVSKHYEGIIPGKRPPLLAGLQVKAELMTPETELISVPLSALHTGNNLPGEPQHWLYMAKPEIKKDNNTSVKNLYRLFKKPQSPLLISEGAALFHPQQFEALSQQGYQIVMNDLTPAINNMLLKASSGEKPAATSSALPAEK